MCYAGRAIDLISSCHECNPKWRQQLGDVGSDPVEPMRLFEETRVYPVLGNQNTIDVRYRSTYHAHMLVVVVVWIHDYIGDKTVERPRR